MKVYPVEHVYDEDGGFGDAIPTAYPVACFLNLEDAKVFVKKYTENKVYDTPYMDLTMLNFEIFEMDLIPSQITAAMFMNNIDLQMKEHPESKTIPYEFNMLFSETCK